MAKRTKKLTALELARKEIESNRAATAKIKSILKAIVSECDLDEGRMAKRIHSATRSEYGVTNGLINLLAAVANWPAEAGDGANVATNSLILEEKLGLDLALLSDIRNYRGHHTFVTDELEIIAGQEPVYDQYSLYCNVLLADLGVESSRPTISETKWQAAEKSAKDRASIELETMRAEIERHKALIGA